MLRVPATLLMALVLVVTMLPLRSFAAEGRIARADAELRHATGFAGPVLSSPAKGTRVEILERRGEWVRVKDSGGREGWTHEIFVEETRADAVAATSPAAVPDPAPTPAAPAEVAPAAPSLPSDCSDVERRFIEAQAELLQLRPESEYQRLKLAEMNRSLAVLHDQLQTALAERDAARAAAAAPPVPAAAVVPAASAAHAQAEPSRVELEARHAEALAAQEARHQQVIEGFIAMVTERHEDALARGTAAIQDECERRLIESNRANEKDLRAARKESGYEAQLEREVRARLDLEIEEAKGKWEAKQRGEMYDVERARREEGERVRKECEGERLAAVAVAAAQAQAALRAALAREREEADLRCQVALALVLERAAQGGDMNKVKELAETTARRRSGDPAADASAEPGAAAEPAPPQPVPVERPIGVPVPVPVPVKPQPHGSRP